MKLTVGDGDRTRQKCGKYSRYVLHFTMSSVYSRRNRPTAGTVPLVRRTRMIREVWVLLGVCLALTRTAEAAQEPPVLVSPDVRADHTIVFRFWAPTAKEVQLFGDWIGG